MPKYLPPFLVLFSAVLWATDTPFRVHVTESIPSTLIVFFEHLFSLIILLPVLFHIGPKWKTLGQKDIVSLLIIGVGSSALALILFTESFHYVNPSVAIILQKLQPFIAIALARILLKERMQKQFWVFGACAIAGAYLISFPTLVPKVFDGEVWNPNTFGVLLALGGAILWGAGTVFGKISLQNFAWKEVTALRFFVGFLFLSIINLCNGDFGLVSRISGVSFMYIFIMSMVSGAIGLLLYYKGLKDTKASIATIAELGFVIGALFINYLFVPGSTLVPVQILGTIIIVTSVLLLSHPKEPYENQA